MKMESKHSKDLVDVVAQKIHYDLVGDELHTSTSSFHIVEPDQPSEPTSTGPHQVCVEFDADVPGTVVVHALRTVLDTIEKDGLPQIDVKMERADAACLMKVQRNVASLSKQVAKMSPELRDVFDRINKQQGLNWGDEVALTKIKKISVPT
jgi:hypothetical protein